MRKNENGEVNVLLIVVVVVSIVAAGFAVAFFWAFSERDNYKNNTESIVAAAVEEARADQTEIERAWFAEEQKKPNLAFAGPADFGSVKFKYPRTWSAYNVENSATKYSVYFHPKMVPNTTDTKSKFALRVSVEAKTYEETLQYYESYVDQGTVTIKPINTGIGGKFKGMRINGRAGTSFNGSIAVFKIRDKSLTIRTDISNYIADFNSLLKTLNFQP